MRNGFKQTSDSKIYLYDSSRVVILYIQQYIIIISFQNNCFNCYHSYLFIEHFELYLHKKKTLLLYYTV